jgi:hypothetical protein
LVNSSPTGLQMLSVAIRIFDVAVVALIFTALT